MYLAPLNCFLHDPLREAAQPIYDTTPGSIVMYIGEDREVVWETVSDDPDDPMHGRTAVPLLELSVQELATLAETLLSQAAGTDPVAREGEIRTTPHGRRVVTGAPEFVGRLATKDGKSGLLIYNVGAVGLV